MDGTATNILVIRLGALGDVANASWAVRSLRRAAPGARIAWLVEEGGGPLVSANPDVDEVIVLPRRHWSHMLRSPREWPTLRRETAAFFRGLRARRFDLLFDFQATLKSGLVAWRSGAPRRVGFSRSFGRERNHFFMTECVTPAAVRQPRAEKYLSLVRHVFPGAPVDRPEVRTSSDETRVIEEFVKSAGLAGAPLVAMHPGTSAFGAFKRWPPERYGQVAARLRECCGARTIVTWGPADATLPNAAVAASSGAAVLAPALSLTLLAALLRRVDLFVASDTGPLHLAALLNRPVVAVFGPKDPVIYGPYGCPAAIVRKDLDCSPCARRECPRPRCIEAITVDDVVGAAVGMMGRK